MRSYDVDRYAGMSQCDFTPLLNGNIREARRRRRAWSSLVSAAGSVRKESVATPARGTELDLNRSHMAIALDLMRRQ